MSQQENASQSEAHDALLVAGMSMIAIGAGVLMSHPGIRKPAKTLLLGAIPELEQAFTGDAVGGVMQDLERYMKIRSGIR